MSSSARPRVSLVAHLQSKRRQSTVGAGREVHPCILKLGLRYSTYRCLGATSRCVEMLKAFKTVISDYVTPPGTTLSRHLMTHMNSQIAYLVSCRPLSVGMGTAIRALKLEISVLDISMRDEDAKQALLDAIDTFVRERINVPGKVIAQNASNTIEDGDVILTFANPHLLAAIFRQARASGRKFRVIVMDSGPFYEGRVLARTLAACHVEVSYALLSALDYCMADVTKIMLGAHAMLANGVASARAGCGMLALAGHERSVPVMMVCETYKFSERVQLDSFVSNELVSPEAVLERDPLQLPKSGGGAMDVQVVYLMYDIIPSKLISVCVSEMGLLPCKSVPVIVNEFKRAELNATKE